MKFLTNASETNNHLSAIIENLKVFDSAFFAVAFLKSSGLNSLEKPIKYFLESGGQLNIVAGLDFALTEPKALCELHKLFTQFPTSKLFLAKDTNSKSVFHPKLYLFKSQNNCCVISGSANITNGGLINNKETSIIVNCADTETIWLDAKNYFDNLSKPENSNEATLLAIKQYESIYKEREKYYKLLAQPIKSIVKSQLSFNYNNLIKYLSKFDSVEREDNLNIKLNNYKEARSILDKIVDSPKLTQTQFEALLDRLVGSEKYHNLWHSGSLYRLRRSVYPFLKEFSDLVSYIRNNKKLPAEIVFDNAKKKVEKIQGAGINYVTEIMMTYNNKSFANLNNNPITVLRKEGGVNIKATPISFSGADYREYCELIKEICSKLKLQNMLEADSFFNEIYWEIKRQSK